MQLRDSTRVVFHSEMYILSSKPGKQHVDCDLFNSVNMFHLVDLQTELQLMIVDHLLPNDIGVRDDDHQKKYNERAEHAPRRDQKKAAKESKSRRDLMSWSCVSSYFRTLLAPYIFRNDEVSATSVSSIAANAK